MSFSAIRSTAYSALSASQVRTQLAAFNIANADTAGYSAKTSTQVTTLTGTLGTGVSVSSIASNVDKYLLADIVASTSKASNATTMADFASQVQALMGSTSSSDGSGTSLAQMLADLETAASDLVASPNSATAKAELVAALDAVTSSLRSTGSAIQTLRGQADTGIADSVDTVNQALETIAALNTQIVSAKNSGQSTADLEDQRNLALQTVAGQLDIAYSVNAEGAMLVGTRSGTILVGNSLNLLSYDPAAAATADTVFGAITVNGQAVSITGGTIGALLDQRDSVLPAMADMLDTLAAGLINSINTAYGDELLTGSGATSIAVSADILANPDLLPAGTAQSLSDAITGDWTFAASGQIGAGTSSFADYASTILGLAATASSTATARAENASTALTGYQDAMSSLTGVNVDEETARLAELEQYYAVAAQILTTLNAMFDSLLSAAQSA
ncbi:MAG: flagellar hook-associated protein FlgK [Candidatus Devosia phytovorans]|uniref:Flagellar hook-associated protein 1 n=1 Tax=Candidatus Devosia phytovorans TaxID=3121372 RepID=A0AAJ5VTN7_9HYPH|nr:flagellar hook-associated protein FlgK [Devosia sp.]WEK03288.1 MAG: flagellar hook-associated protein FlgK [Devosia sp.]